MSEQDGHTLLSISENHAFLMRAIIASDLEYKYWPQKEVQEAQTSLLRQNITPSAGLLYHHFGQEQTDAFVEQVLTQRVSWLQLQDALQGTRDPCHSCKSEEALTYHEFGLARIEKKERDWTSTGLSVAISAVTIPLLGGGVFSTPSKTTSASIMRMKLVLCPSCVERNRGLFGGFNPGASICHLHPLWKQLQEAGFTKFLNKKDLSEWSSA